MHFSRHREQVFAKRVLNVRLLIWTVVIVVLAAPAVYTVRAVQVRRNAGILFDRAQELEKQGDLPSASRTLFRYLQFRPDDGTSRVLLAQIFDKTATTLLTKERAVEHYYAALTYFEDRLDLRTRLAELLLELHREQDAETECLRVLFGPLSPKRADVIAGIKRYQDKLQTTKLIASNPDSAKALRLLAFACFERAENTADWSPSDQLTVVKSALAADPNSIELTMLQARIYRERLQEPSLEEREKFADNLVTQLADSHPNIAQANLAAYRYRREYELPEADAVLDKALANSPDDYEILVSAGVRAQAQDNLDDASSYFRRAVGRSPTDPRAHAGLVQVLLMRQATNEALEVCRKGLLLCGQDEITINLAKLQAQIQDGQVEAAQPTLDTIKRQQERIGPFLKLAQRIQLRDAVSLLEADHAIASGKSLRGAAILRQLTVNRSGERSQAKDRMLRANRFRRLAQIYGQLQYWELAAKAHEQEAALQSASYAPLLAAGRAWFAAGCFDEAIAAFEAGLAAPDAQADGWIVLARAELARQMKLTDRDWTKCDAALRQARQLMEDSPSVGMLNVELQQAKGENSTALDTLAQIVTLHPKEVLPFAVLFYETAGHKDRSDECLEQLKTLKSSETREITTLEAEVCRRRKDFDRAKLLLSRLIDESKGTDRYDLRRQLASIEIESGGPRSDAQLHLLSEQYPDDPWPLERMADLAFSRHDFSRLAELDAALEKVEGSNGTLWRFYRAMRLISEPNDGQVARFAQASKLHSELQSLRPAWSSTFHLKGRIAQQQGRIEEAAEAYKSAIEAGASSVTVYEGLVTLLYANNRWLEADAFLSRLQQVGYQSPMLDSFASRLLLRQGEFDDAVSAARSGIKLRPKDSLAHVWLGQTLVLAGGRHSDITTRQLTIQEAKTSFETAIELAPEDYRTWSGLLWYGVRTGDKQATVRAMDGLRGKAKLTEPQRMLALGQAHQLLGEHGQAEESFVRAVRLVPRDPAIQERLAQFYLAYSPEKAEQAFRRLLELTPDSKTARRTLAMLLVTNGTDSQFAEASKLLRDAGDESTDRRLQAVLLMQRGGKDNLRDACKLLDALIRGTVNPNSTDRHLLAIVAEADGDLATARGQLVKLATDTKNAAYVSALIEFLLRHNQHQDAAGYLKRLSELEPNSLRTVQVQLKWMKHTSASNTEIKNVIQQFEAANRASASDEMQRLNLLNFTVGMYMQFGLHVEAESRFRTFLRETPSIRAQQAFALWLVKNQRISEAVQFALDGLKTDRNDASFQLLSNVLAIAASQGQRFASAESQVDQFVHSNLNNAQLLFELATLKHMLGEDEVAVKLYEQSIQLTPGNAFAHNNLAMLLLDGRGTTGDSLFHIEEALRIAGPNPELRDTYAIVLAQRGNVGEASRILKSLVSRFPRNPRYLFHLAFAFEKSGDRAAASESLAKAQNHDLDAETLTPQEQRMLKDLRRQLAGSGAAEQS